MNKNKIKVIKTNDEWKKILTEEQFEIIINKGTEYPHSGKYNLHFEKGTYKCVACGESLFTDEMKFKSECGWPSFDNEIPGNKIIKQIDTSHGMNRTEIICANCGGHLGHLFNDGTTNTGMRYCVNSVSLDFESREIAKNNLDTITLAGGCFWCIETIFADINGVIDVKSGYTGGKTNYPSYKDVCTGETGHAEAIEIIYDKTIISYEKLLEVFFTVHNPTTLNQQGNDIGTQYRSAIFYRNEIQREISKKIIDNLNINNVFDNPIVTSIEKFSVFYIAEDYHQDYFQLNGENPYCKMVVKPKYEKFRKTYADILKK